MADPRFFTAQGPFDLAELAVIAEAELSPGADGTRRVVDIAPLEAAGGDTISFLDNRRYIEAFTRSRAGACIVPPDVAEQAPQGMALLLSGEPYRAFARVARAFYPPPRVKPGIAQTAVIDAEARLGPGCRVDAGAVIGPRCEIGARCHIGANAAIETGVVIGDDCIVGACASLSHCRVGDRVTIYPGARIGQEGFGFAPSPAGHLRIPHTGRVIIEDDVEVGANATIDRGSGPDTIIGAGSMIDNLVQIAHNVRLGKGCVLAAQVGISGSTKLGDFVVCGGQVGLAGHLTIGDGVQLAARAGLMHDIPPGRVYAGTPAVPLVQWKRQVVALARLVERKGKG
ncbi:MAG: UDP-3-O-(3-hydroxymyristoyl)glucosamine N-acyltransferase [Alphaproteobacteria bacterium]